MLTSLIHPNAWPLLQLIACLIVVAQLLTFRRGTSRHRHGIAWLAWLMVVACTMTSVKLVCGIRPPPGPLESLLCVALAVVVCVHRGDLAHVLRSIAALVAGLRRRARR